MKFKNPAIKKMVAKEVKTITLNYNDDYRIDIVESHDDRCDIDMWEAWIYRNHCGMKSYMWGQEAFGNGMVAIEEFIFDVISAADEHIELYEQEIELSEEAFMRKFEEEHSCEEN